MILEVEINAKVGVQTYRSRLNTLSYKGLKIALDEMRKSETALGLLFHRRTTPRRARRCVSVSLHLTHTLKLLKI